MEWKNSLRWWVLTWSGVLLLIDYTQASRELHDIEDSLATTVFTSYKLALQWPPTVCSPERYCDNIQKRDFSIRGLWPEDITTSPRNCNPNAPFDITQIQNLRSRLEREWDSYTNITSQVVWGNEWVEHGTCSNLAQNAYFSLALELRAATGNIAAALAAQGVQTGGFYTFQTYQKTFQSILESEVELACRKRTDPLLLIYEIQEVRICLSKTSPYARLNCAQPTIPSCPTNVSILLPKFAQAPIPPFSYYKLALQWPPTVCSPARCNNIQKRDFSIHGLWPEAITPPRNCDLDAPLNITQIQNLTSELAREWKSYTNSENQVFWAHEWVAHGTCTKLSQYAYFSLTLQLRNAIGNIATALAPQGIQVGGSYTFQVYQRAFQSILQSEVELSCKKRSATTYQIQEVRICLSQTSPYARLNCAEPTIPSCPTNVSIIFPNFA